MAAGYAVAYHCVERVNVFALLSFSSVSGGFFFPLNGLSLLPNHHLCQQKVILYIGSNAKRRLLSISLCVCVGVSV